MMLPVIKIGLTHTGTEEKHNNYVRWLQGTRIEVVTLSADETSLESIKNLDGIVLSGGVDVQPKYYKSDVINYPNAPDTFNEKRDEFEIAVYTLSRQNNMPLLAICRGMQLVNCILGGTLKQDIGEVANKIHRFEVNDKAHGINITAGSLLHEITGVERTVTNSAHHQAIDVLGDGLKINCLADDGIVEGIEWLQPDGKPFFLGVQAHPERMYKFNLEQLAITKNIRDRFIKEVNKSVEKL